MIPGASRRAFAFGCAAAIAALSARGAAASERRLVYAMRVAGIAVADMELRFRPTGRLVPVELEVRNRGLASWLSGRNRTTMSAIVVGDGPDGPAPARFRAIYLKPDRVRETELAFDREGGLTRLVVRNRGREQPSPVPEELREPSIDPLTALLRMSHWLEAGPEPEAEFSAPVFEGRKRGDLQLRYVGPATIDNRGRPREAHHLRAALLGLSGFESDDAMVTLPGEPLDWIEVYASADDWPMPILLRSQSSRLPASIELVDVG